MKILGNICISLAALLYLLPLQHLLLEYARKRDDGGGAFAAILILVPLWLFLLAGLLIAAAQGGFDGLPLRRGFSLYATIIAATLALAVVTFMSFASLNRPTWAVRLTLGLPVYLVPPLTIAFIAVALNPGLAPRPSLGALRLSWTIFAGLSLIGCASYLGLAAVRRASTTVGQFVHNQRQNPVIEARILAETPLLDPLSNFYTLLSRAAYADSPEVRRLATQRLRTHPDFVGELIEHLAKTEPDTAIAFVAAAELSDEERRRIAGPLYTSMRDYGDYIHGRLHFYPKDWKSRQKAWGHRIYPAIAGKFAGAGFDFASLPEAFQQAFVPDAP